MNEPTPTVRVAVFDDLTARQIYEIAKLRVDVFVVEQNCAYPELDGRDAEPSAVQFWIQDGARVVSTLRLLRDVNEFRIGRVATALDHRGSGLSGLLMAAALERCGVEPVVIGAQVQLEKWYQKFGFERSGVDYDDDGIMHLPMRRELNQ